jgi:hypothetical protein
VQMIVLGLIVIVGVVLHNVKTSRAG